MISYFEWLYELAINEVYVPKTLISETLRDFYRDEVFVESWIQDDSLGGRFTLADVQISEITAKYDDPLRVKTEISSVLETIFWEAREDAARAAQKLASALGKARERGLTSKEPPKVPGIPITAPERSPEEAEAELAPPKPRPKAEPKPKPEPKPLLPAETEPVAKKSEPKPIEPRKLDRYDQASRELGLPRDLVVSLENPPHDYSALRSTMDELIDSGVDLDKIVRRFPGIKDSLERALMFRGEGWRASNWG